MTTKKQTSSRGQGRPHIKAAARDATGVATVRGGRRFCNFAKHRQLTEGAPVSGMPICGQRAQGISRSRRMIVTRKGEQS